MKNFDDKAKSEKNKNNNMRFSRNQTILPGS